MACPSTAALSRNLLDRVTEEEIYSRQTDRQCSLQYSTLRDSEVVHAAVCCSLSTLPFRNAQFHLTETSVSADTDGGHHTAWLTARVIPHTHTHTHTNKQTNNSHRKYSVTLGRVRATTATVEKQ
jgi:hypothetical protein